MIRNWLKGWRKFLVGSCAALLIGTGQGRAQDKDADLRAQLAEQARQIQELKKLVEAQQAQPVAQGQGGQLNDDAVKKIVADYLKENPGAGAKSDPKAGYSWGKGFFIKDSVKPPDGGCCAWEEQSKIPFELRFRGRLQLDYYGYKITDNTNHQTNKSGAIPTNANRLADFSQLEVKRFRMIWEGTAFDPNLKFNFTFDGNTRGLGGVLNNKVIQSTGGTVSPSGTPTTFTGFNAVNASPTGAGATVDHAVRLFEAWVSYDFHPMGTPPEGGYTPTVTAIAGKQKPFFGLEEILGSGNQFMVEYNMADWFFDADDDNLMMAAGFRTKAMDDRLYIVNLITNGSESQFANTQMDVLPGFVNGFWYDFGGDWDAQKQKWKLFGDYLSDLEYHCNPVLRVGGSTNIVLMNRRSEYGDDEQSRFFVSGPGPGGTRLINVLNGGIAQAGFVPNGRNAVDEFDAYSFDAWAAAKYRGLSVWNEWWYRDLNAFHSPAAGRDLILYQDSLGHNALFPRKVLSDYGTAIGVGYFVVPKKFELVARYSMVSGNSGDINGNGKVTTTNVPGVGTVDVVQGAFHNYHTAQEFAVGFNYYWFGQLLKWQTDFSVYDGGNPAGGGVSPAGFIAGSDGWMIRTQIQLWF
jgi:hypothetical protein